MRVDLQTLQALQLAHAEQDFDKGAAMRELMWQWSDAILHDLALLARIQASLQGVGEVATRG